MVLEIDQPVSEAVIKELESKDGILKVTFLNVNG